MGQREPQQAKGADDVDTDVGKVVGPVATPAPGTVSANGSAASSAGTRMANTPDGKVLPGVAKLARRWAKGEASADKNSGPHLNGEVGAEGHGVHADAGGGIDGYAVPGVHADFSAKNAKGDGVSAHASLDVAIRAIDLRVEAKMGLVDVVVAMRGCGLLRVTLSLGDKHKKMNKVLHIMSELAAAGINPIGYAISEGFVLGGKGYDKLHAKEDADSTPADATTATTPAAKTTPSASADTTPVALLLPEDCEALISAGMLSGDTLVPGMITKEALDASGLDPEQAVALASLAY